MASGKQDRSMIIEAIKRAEAQTTAEIQVHLSRNFFERDALKRAQKTFLRLGMHKTAKRNGVLLYINIRKRKIAIVGDVGINQLVGSDFWSETVQTLVSRLKVKKLNEAVAASVLDMGSILKKYFPKNMDGPSALLELNELSDEVTED